MFYFFVSSMMIIAGFFVVAPLIFRPSAGIERPDINILVFQARLKEIKEGLLLNVLNVIKNK